MEEAISKPVLRWLPTKLAEWIGENLQEDLGFPDKGVRAQMHESVQHAQAHARSRACAQTQMLALARVSKHTRT